MPRLKSSPGKVKPLYRQKPPALPPALPPETDLAPGIPLAPAHFELHDDGSIGPLPFTEVAQPLKTPPPRLLFTSDTPWLRLYQGNCLELLDAIAAKYPEGRFDAIFADPPYFLSNGGITCHAGRMVKVDKGAWDKSQGVEENHNFNRQWLERCQRVLKPHGTLWVSGTHHVIFSIGYAMQQLGFKVLNDIAWEKPNPPPNLSCRYFTHSTETILWAAKNEKSKHVFNYAAMRAVTGKQMKTVWTITAPGGAEKTFGKHPTQKPVALIERCLLASTNEGDLVLDPFLGGGTTAIAALRLKRGCVGIEADAGHLALAVKRVDHEIITLWLRTFQVRTDIFIGGASVLASRGEGESLVDCRAQALGGRSSLSNQCPGQIDLDLFSDSINGSRCMADVPQVPTERIYHECKFVFLSAAQVDRGAVVHTTVDVSLQEAWAKTPTGKKRETTHIVRCETEILRVKSS